MSETALRLSASKEPHMARRKDQEEEKAYDSAADAQLAAELALLEKAEVLERKFKKLKKKMKGSLDVSDLHQKELLRLMLDSTVAIVPVAFKQYMLKKGESMLYAYNGAVNQSKDLLALMRQMTDSEGQAAYLTNDVVGPSLVGATQHLMTMINVVKGSIDDTKIKSKDARYIKQKLDEALRDHAIYLNEMNRMLGDRIRQFMVNGGVAIEAEPAKKRKKPATREKADG